MLNKCQIKKPTSQEAERAGDHSFCSQKCAVTCFSAHPGSSHKSLFSWALDALLVQRGEGRGGEWAAYTAIFFTTEHISCGNRSKVSGWTSSATVHWKSVRVKASFPLTLLLPSCLCQDLVSKLLSWVLVLWPSGSYFSTVNSHQRVVEFITQDTQPDCPRSTGCRYRQPRSPTMAGDAWYLSSRITKRLLECVVKQPPPAPSLSLRQHLFYMQDERWERGAAWWEGEAQSAVTSAFQILSSSVTDTVNTTTILRTTTYWTLTVHPALCKSIQCVLSSPGRPEVPLRVPISSPISIVFTPSSG